MIVSILEFRYSKEMQFINLFRQIEIQMFGTKNKTVSHFYYSIITDFDSMV